VAQETVQEILRLFREEAKDSALSRAEFERLKGRFLGRDGFVPGLFGRVRELSPAERGEFGRQANAAKTEIEDQIARLGEELARREASERERTSVVDGTN